MEGLWKFIKSAAAMTAAGTAMLLFAGLTLYAIIWMGHLMFAYLPMPV